MTSETTRSGQNQPFSMDDFAKALEQYDYQFEKGQVVRGKVLEIAAEGAYVDIGGKSSGFVPLKEASLKQVDDLAEILPLEEEMDFLIIREQNAEGQVTLSRRQLQLKEAWENLTEIANSGKSVEVRVTGVNRGGVTGDVEGLRAFIPRSHLQQKENLDSLIDEWLTVNFLEIDPERNKLVLSQRQAVRAAALTNLETGALMSGKVVSIKPYGVFVDINGATGLLHIKQVSGTHIDSLTTVFNIGQEIKVMIVEIDEIKNRISLSTKVLENFPGEILENMDEVMLNASERAEKARQKRSE